MSTIEIYNPKFDDFHGEPYVTWREKSNHEPRFTMNLLEQYNKWKIERSLRNDPPEAFWQSCGPAIVRALGFCGAKALVFDWASDRKVAYCWFLKKPSGCGSGADYYYVLPVHAEGGMPGCDSRVHVDLPDGEAVHFEFRWSQMQGWVKPKKPDEYACMLCTKTFSSKSELAVHISKPCVTP